MKNNSVKSSVRDAAKGHFARQGSTATPAAAPVSTRTLVEVPTVNPDKLDNVGFIMACEDGSITQDQFDASAQAFVDSGVWRQLQGSWQRTVRDWADQGLVTVS